MQDLGKDVPEVPFPNVNESAELKRAIIMMKTVSYGWIRFACVSLVARDVIANRVRKRHCADKIGKDRRSQRGVQAIAK